MRMYRGKTEDGEWVEGYHVKVMDREGDDIHLIATADTSYEDVDGHWMISDTTEVIPESVGQSTGWKDVRGTESYHHDIVKSKHYGRGEIVWAGQGWVVADEAGTFYSLSYEFTIIGTIHDNPKLLEAKK